MLGSIIGDILGSAYEFNNFKTERPDEVELFVPESHFTDDSVLTVATAEALLTDRDYQRHANEWGHLYPDAGYGWSFRHWLGAKKKAPYNSWGNGSAMRVAPVGWAFSTIEETIAEATLSAEFTHNHPEGLKGAQSVAAAIFLARTGHSKQDIHAYISQNFGYNLDRKVAKIRPGYKFNESCQETVPEALIVFFESVDFEDAMRLGISLGGDTDTLCCICGGIAEAFYGKLPQSLVDFARVRLEDKMLKVIDTFYEKWIKEKQ
jgi:ADP-ribosylglycohydrolase